MSVDKKGMARLKEVKRVCVICLASALMAVNINTFVHAGGLYPGGAMGLTILIQRLAGTVWSLDLPYTAVNAALNAAPFYIGFRFIGKRFTLYSLFSIMITGVLADWLPYYAITYDTLLISIFGGIINGTVIAICLREHATTGGANLIAIYMSKRKGRDSFNLIFGLNAVILTVAGLIFGWDKALYSIIFQFVSTQMIHLMYKRYSQDTVLIVTRRPEETCRKIYELSCHGATLLKGEGSHEHVERHIVYSVISSSDRARIIQAVRQIDAEAFVNVIKTDQLAGHFYYEPQD